MDATVIGFVGRLTADKGIRELASAWGEISHQWTTAHLLVVGPLEMSEAVRSAVTQVLSDNKRVHFVGADWDTGPLYAAMDLLVLPTYREGFPNVILEASAMELPVVATDVPGCIDAVDNHQTGTLVPVEDVSALVDAITKYLRSRFLRASHGLNGRRRVLRHFRRDKIWRGILHEYHSLLGATGR